MAYNLTQKLMQSHIDMRLDVPQHTCVVHPGQFSAMFLCAFWTQAFRFWFQDLLLFFKNVRSSYLCPKFRHISINSFAELVRSLFL